MVLSSWLFCSLFIFINKPWILSEDFFGCVFEFWTWSMLIKHCLYFIIIRRVNVFHASFYCSLHNLIIPYFITSLNKTDIYFLSSFLSFFFLNINLFTNIRHQPCITYGILIIILIIIPTTGICASGHMGLISKVLLARKKKVVVKCQ